MIELIRYYTEKEGMPQKEVIRIQGVPDNDMRGRPIGQKNDFNVDKWIVVMVMNPAFEIGIPPVSNFTIQKGLDSDGNIVENKIPLPPNMNDPAYYNSSWWDMPSTKPLRAGVTLIATEDEYWAQLSAFVKANKKQ